MKYKFEYKPYKRQFKEILQTPDGMWRWREGIIIKLKDEESNIGFGEIAPLPGFGSETLEEALEYCRIMGNGIDDRTIENIPKNLPCCKCALESALWEMGKAPAPEINHKMESTALIARGYKCVKEVESLLKMGYRTFKWKIGLETVKEFTIYNQLKAILPDDAKLRIDANASLHSSSAKYWMKQFEGGPVEYFEQPLPRENVQEMRALALMHKTPIALDESAGTIAEIKKVTDDGWPGPIIVKPSLLGSITEFIEWRKTCEHKLIYSSSFETAIGMQTLLKLAASSPTPPPPIGIGTLDYFKDDGLSLHHNAPQINLWRFTADDFDRIWHLL